MPQDDVIQDDEMDHDQLLDDDSFPPVREAPPPAIDDTNDELPRGGDKFTRALRGTQPIGKTKQKAATPPPPPPESPSPGKIRQSSDAQ